MAKSSPKQLAARKKFMAMIQKKKSSGSAKKK